MKVCIASSSGGHLQQALRLKEAYKNKDYFFITERRSNGLDLAKKERVYFISPPRRKWYRLIVSFLQTLRIFIIERPSIIISTGAEIGYPAIMLGWVLRKKVIYIETFARIDRMSLTGRLVYPFIKDFYVQWEELAKKYPKSKYVGAVY
jgi:beta-1,4-N-acetylglucosaminyltransferase